MEIFKLKLKKRDSSVEKVHTDQGLKRLLSYYAASALLATIFVSASILTETYITSLSDTLNKFQTLKINSIKMKESSKRAGQMLTAVKAMFKSYDNPEALEGSILTTVDTIKSRMKDVNITVTNFERKGSEILLPITLTGQIRDYTMFVNHLGYLQSLNSPLFYINSVSFSDQSESNRARINFEISGILKMEFGHYGD